MTDKVCFEFGTFPLLAAQPFNVNPYFSFTPVYSKYMAVSYYQLYLDCFAELVETRLWAI